MRQVRDLDDPARRPVDGGPDLGHAEHRHDAGVERPGGEHDLVGAGDGVERIRARGRVLGREPDVVDAAVLARRGHDRDLAGHAIGADRAVIETGPTVAGRTRPTAPSRRPGLVERGGEIAERLGQADDEEVAERMVGELAGTETVLERRRPGLGVVGRERDEAAPEVAGRGNVEVAPEAAGAAAVVGDADDRGDLARVLADRRAARRPGRALRPMQRCSARTSGVAVDVSVMDRRPVAVARAAVRRAASATTTLRCRPPVHPTPIDR